MAKTLVIVESPAKAKTIGRYLGKGYDVEATMGHIRDLPTKGLGVDVKHDFAPEYEVLASRKKIVSELKKKAAGAERVFLAPDLDREGEAIAWHVKETLKIPDDKAFRVTFNEITKNAIEKAFHSPGKISIDKVNAQQARRILDRLVGYEISPILWRKIPRTTGRNLSAGRVQSVAVRLIVEREREIEAFKAEEFWRITATFSADGVAFEAEFQTKDGEKLPLANEASAKAVLDALAGAQYVVESIETKETRSNPAPPFTTSTLQQAASTLYRFPAKKTMRLAQDLYEGLDLGPEGPVALITYMRTDSVRISNEAIAAIRSHILDAYGKEYLTDKPRAHVSKGKTQEAHEAVRPTYVERMPESVKQYLDEDHYRLYDLIWRRAVASQMAAAVFRITTATIGAGPYGFAAKGRVVAFKGHTVLSSSEDDGEGVLPDLKTGQTLALKSIEPSQHFTQAPARFTEAALVKTLEKEGIGRPSTYATIISTIQERGYVIQRNRLFYPTPLGVFVTDKLVKHFPNILDVGFTRHMEDELDEVESGDMDWVALLKEFYVAFEESLGKAKEEMTPFEETDEVCPLCGKKLVKRLSKAGLFLGCSGYPECKYTRNLSATGAAIEAPQEERKCPTCGKPLTLRSGPRGAFMGCTGYPDCTYTEAVVKSEAGGKTQGDAAAEPLPEVPAKNCPDCGKPLKVRTGKRGAFLGCSGYPKCRHTEPLPEDASAAPGEPGTGEPPADRAAGSAAPRPEQPAVEKKCPNCGKTLVVKQSRRGPFLACPGYPECKHAESLSGVPAGAKPRAEKTGRQCPECGKDLVVRTGKRGRFVGCSGYPKCRYTEDAS
jgi:DNA topoisomerase-1